MPHPRFYIHSHITSPKLTLHLGHYSIAFIVNPNVAIVLRCHLPNQPRERHWTETKFQLVLHTPDQSIPRAGRRILLAQCVFGFLRLNLTAVSPHSNPNPNPTKKAKTESTENECTGKYDIQHWLLALYSCT